MRKILCFLLLLSTFKAHSQALSTPFEKSNGNQTSVYSEIIDWWKKLDLQYPQVKMRTIGATDAGFPLTVVMVGKDSNYSFQRPKNSKTTVILINNGIHPGEPDGIDASMMLARDIVTGKLALPENVVLAIVPVYNIGGCLDRSKNYRVDQNGPEEFGFRGNSQNLDLNRDFIKMDSKEAKAFVAMYRMIDPDVMIDNHVSNGADYQHVMTLIASQHNKLGGAMGEFMNKQFEPGIYALMKKKGYDLVPYVNSFGESPEQGWPEFLEGPRYSSGYASLWQTFAFVPESHMLKPYAQRVKATYAMMECFIQFTSENAETIIGLRQRARLENITRAEFPINWTLNRNASSTIQFRGYTAGYKPSTISGLPRLYYDRTKPFTKEVKFYNEYTADKNIKKPKAYIIPQGWWEVIDRLKLNKVQYYQLFRDTVMTVEVYHIDGYNAGARPYEKHHLNGDVKLTASQLSMKFRKGDVVIPMNQEANRFVMEVLEPQAPDSYFAWNFFDAILGQKEGYSDYVFEETAAEFLKGSPAVKKMLDGKRASDTAFARNGGAQLEFVYRNSPYYEPANMRYPVYRLLQ